MINLNNLAKYSLNQLEGKLNQLKRRYQIYRIWTIIFLTLMLAFMVVSVVSLIFYIMKARGNYPMFYLTISSSVIFGVFAVLFFVFLAVNINQNKKPMRMLNNYLKQQKKK